MRPRRSQRPPKRHCRDCGTDVYAWTESPLCPDCVAAVRMPGQPVEGETLREFRRRVIDPTRNGLRDS